MKKIIDGNIGLRDTILKSILEEDDCKRSSEAQEGKVKDASGWNHDDTIIG